MAYATKIRQRNRSGIKAAAEAAFDHVLRGLNPAQRQAVDAIEGPVMVLAGPGTGKTQVLAARVANILRQTQMDPWNILCLTFTESGVVAMRQRLTSIIGPAAYRVRVATFHGFCNDLIQEFSEKFALRSEWQVLSDVERLQVWQHLVDRLPAGNPLKPFGDPYLFVTDMNDRVRTLKQEDIAPAQLRESLEQLGQLLQAALQPLRDFFALKTAERTEDSCDHLRGRLLQEAERCGMQLAWLGFLSDLFDRDLAEGKARTKLTHDLKRWFEASQRQLPRQRALVHVYENYQRELKKRGRYDYEDMIMAVVARLKQDTDLLAYCQEQFQYVLVDEYQDTNSAQNEFLQLLTAGVEQPNVFVVGDDKQSIFRFQGASLENLRFFYELFKADVTVISLPENYRSQPQILFAADGLISHNRESVAKYIPGLAGKLRPRSGRVEQLIIAQTYASEAAERQGVATRIQELIFQGVAPPAIAVLYRYNRDALPMQAALSALNIPVRVEADEDVLDDVAVHQLVQLMTYLSGDRITQRSGASDERLAEILQYQFWGFEGVDVARLLHQAASARKNLWPLMMTSPTFAPLAKRLAEWRVALPNHTLSRWLDIVLHESGYLTWWLKDHGVATVGKLNRFLGELQRLAYARHSLTVREFVDQLQVLKNHGLGLTVDSAAFTGEGGRVRLMTVHKAKGLEFEHVFLVQVADRHWGNVAGRQRLPLPHGLLKYDVMAEDTSDEDERRLFYVAMTRARQGLYLSWSRQTDSGRAQVPAVFWHEIPRECMTEVEIPETEAGVVERRHEALERPLLEKREDQSLAQWLSERLSQYVMSVTALNHYLECPRLFYYRDLLSVPVAKTKHQAFGSAVHNALRDFLAEYREGGEIPSLERLLDGFARAVAREVLTPAQAADSLALGNDLLRGYYHHYQAEFSPPLFLEYDFRNHGLDVGGLRLTGKIDKVEREGTRGRGAALVDYKTGNPDTAAKAVKPGGSYHRQLVFYKLLTELSPRFPYDVRSGVIDFIQPSKRTGKFVRRKFDMTRTDADELKEIIARVWQEMQELKFLDPAAACGKCEYCTSFR